MQQPLITKVNKNTEIQGPAERLVPVLASCALVYLYCSNFCYKRLLRSPTTKSEEISLPVYRSFLAHSGEQHGIVNVIVSGKIIVRLAIHSGAVILLPEQDLYHCADILGYV